MTDIDSPQATYNQDKFIKGVFMDKKLGNFLKLDSSRRVVVCSRPKAPFAAIAELLFRWLFMERTNIMIHKYNKYIPLQSNLKA